MRLVWDKIGDHLYETGTDRGVLYPIDTKTNTYPNGVAWSGLTAVTESPSGAEATDIYADNIKYVTMRSAEEFGYTIEAYYYPDEWNECDGSSEPVQGVNFGQQKRRAFGLCYRSKLGNDTEQDDYGYKLHLIYNSTASPSERSYATTNDSPDAITFSWECSTTPIATTVKATDGSELKPVACITIDSTKADPAKLKALEDILYGKDGSGDSDTGVPARLPLPDEVYTIMKKTTG